MAASKLKNKITISIYEDHGKIDFKEYPDILAQALDYLMDGKMEVK